MTALDIVNNFSHPVILADDRNADKSWARHKANGSAGGVDLAYPLNSPVEAPAAGVWYFFPNQGTAGNVGHILIGGGWSVIFEHLMPTDHLPNGTFVKVDQVVAHSGNSGGVQPHLHVHLLDPQGQRVNIFHHFTKTSTASSGVVKILEKLMANSPTGKANFYDKSTNIRYQFELGATPGVTVIGTKDLAETTLMASSASAKGLDHSQVRAICSRNGVKPMSSALALHVKKVKNAIYE
jgi:murein DD-endopeptidase MepM/ murein hydrolase activator NlpD